jgi:hypothetical protein
MRIILIILGLLAGSIVYGQDSTWNRVRINEDLAVRLPGEITKEEQETEKAIAGGKLIIYKAITEYSVLGITVTPNALDMGMNGKKSNKQLLDEIEEGARKGSKLKGYECETYPTMVDGIEGIKLLMYGSDTSSAPYIQQYIVVINNRMYSFFQAPNDPKISAPEDEMKILLKSVRFNHNAVKAQKFESEGKSRGYKVGYTIGQFLGYLIIAGIIWLIVRLIISKSKKKQDVKDNYNY